MKPTCQDVLRLLDAEIDRALAPDERERIRRHADGCPACAALLRLHDHLALGAADQLEAAVPASLVADVWPRLETRRAAARAAASEPGPTRRRARGWHLAAAVAAVVVVTLGAATTWLGLENRRLREDVAAVTRVAALPIDAGRQARARGPLWPTTDVVTVGEVVAVLRELPPSTRVLSPDLARSALAELRGHGLARSRHGFSTTVGRDGLQAADAVAWLDTMDPSTRLPLSRGAFEHLTSVFVQ